MPVFCFAISFAPTIDWSRAALIFVLLHVFLYPASNGYNSYMDRDETSIGGIAHPMQPTKQLFYTTVAMDIIAALLSFLVSNWFAAAFIFYIICSRLYSYRGIRLKRFPIIGYITVILNQGALTFAMVYHGVSQNLTLQFPWLAVMAAAFLIGGFYPITQIYQHETDAADGVTTMSMLLGKRGTFAFCGTMYAIAFTLLFCFYRQHNQLSNFYVLQIFFIPVAVVFIRWMLQVFKDASKANFTNTMHMNLLAGTCTNLAFITLLIKQHLG